MSLIVHLFSKSLPEELHVAEFAAVLLQFPLELMYVLFEFAKSCFHGFALHASVFQRPLGLLPNATSYHGISHVLADKMTQTLSFRAIGFGFSDLSGFDA